MYNVIASYYNINPDIQLHDPHYMVTLNIFSFHETEETK